MKESLSFSELNASESNDFNKNNSVKQAEAEKIPEEPSSK